MRSMKNVDNRSQLQQQIDYRKYKEDMEKQEAYLADKQTQYMEKLHQQVTISSLYIYTCSYVVRYRPNSPYHHVCICGVETYGARWYGSRPPTAEKE